MDDLNWTERRLILTRPLTTERFGKGEVIATELVVQEPDTIAIEEIEALDIRDREPTRAELLSISSILIGMAADDLARLHAIDFRALGEVVGSALLAVHAEAGDDGEVGEAPAEADDGLPSSA